MRLKLLGAAVATMIISAPASATEVVYYFTGSGLHLEQSGYTSNQPILVSTGQIGGAFYFDPSLAATDADGNFTISGTNPGTMSATYLASIIGNQLSFSYTTTAYFGSSVLDVDVWFENGYLALGFPTDIDFSRAVSSHYEFSQFIGITSGGHNYWGNGSLTSFSSVGGNFVNVAFYANPVTFIADVPEPSTWAMMLVGFGAVGLSMRRRRKAALTVELA